MEKAEKFRMRKYLKNTGTNTLSKGSSRSPISWNILTLEMNLK